MAEKVAATTGVWSAAATWNSVTNTPTIHLATNITVDTTGVFSATFTAPNLVNAVTGIVLFIPVQTVNPATLTATLQESGVDTAAVVSVTLSNLNIATGLHTADGILVYLRLATPYVFTTLTAGAYRWKLTVDTSTLAVAANSAGTAFTYRSTDDRTGVPASTDDVLIVGQNGTTAITVTVDGSQTIGSGTYIETTSEEMAERVVGHAVVIGEDGVLAWDTAASATLTIGGNLLVSPNGTWRMGTVASPYPTGKVAKLIFNVGGVAAKFGIKVSEGGIVELQGLAKSSTSLWKTKLSSGVGTAASPMVTADAVDWLVDDEIIIVPTSNSATNYNEFERRFIKTKNSATSYVLSTTIGGAEAAFTFTHSTDAWIINLTRNVVIESTVTTFGPFWQIYGPVSGQIGSVNIDWLRLNTPDGKTPGRNLRAIVVTTAAITASIDYCVIDNVIGGSRGWYLRGNNTNQTYTGLVTTDNNASVGGSFYFEDTRSQIFVDCFAIDINVVGYGFFMLGVSGITFTRCYAFAHAGTSNIRGPWYVQGAFNCIFNACESHANRFAGIVLASSSARDTFINCAFGTKGNNVNDIAVATGQYFDVVFENTSFGSTTLVNNYLNLAPGSEIKFHKANGTENNHFWYTRYGIARNSGAGLVDTTTKTVGNFAVRIAPEDSTTGLAWEFLIGISANSAASVFGFIQKNAAFGTSVCTVELFLPGSTVADASQTMGNTTGTWLVFTLAASYTGSVAAFARVRITAKTTTAAAYVYVADLYNGTNVLTSFKAWNDGKPSPVFTDLLGDPASVWAQLTSTFTTVGTVGYQVTNDLNDLQTALQAVDDLVDDLETRLTAGRAANLDNLDATISSRASQTSLNTLNDYVDTEITDIQNRLPAALVGGRMDVSVGAMAADVITAAALSSGAVSEIITAIFAQMLEGLAYEEIIKDIWAQVVGDAVADDATNPTLLQYDGPNGALQLTHTRTPTTRTKV